MSFRTPAVQGVLDGPDSHLKEKLAYVIDRLERDDLDQSDRAFTAQTYKQLVREIEKTT